MMPLLVFALGLMLVCFSPVVGVMFGDFDDHPGPIAVGIGFGLIAIGCAIGMLI